MAKAPYAERVHKFDLDRAVRAGIIRSDQADALRRFDEREHAAPGASEEYFALVSGFADVMAAVGLALVFGTTIAMTTVFPLSSAAFPFICWGAATYFTARRRMMLSSMLIFAFFALATAMASLAIGLMVMGLSPMQVTIDDLPAFVAVVVAAVCTIACWVYWQRFQLPIAVAATAVAAINLLICILRWIVPSMSDGGVEAVFSLAGPALFAVAMWWDMSDVRRETVRSDVAFWLHIAAGFMIVQAAMALLLGRTSGASGWARLFSGLNQQSGGPEALAVVGLFLLFAAIALIIDRRSLLTSGMIYFVPALGSLLTGTVNAIAPALLVSGVMLTALAVKWGELREALLRLLPDPIVAQLPRPQIKAAGPRPVY